MKSFYTFIVSALLIASTVSSASAEGKILVDPNESFVPEKSDTRLAQKITCSLEKQPVAEILKILSTMTGVTLNAGYTDQDWQVRDRRMNIFIKDMPLQELMTSIARVMNFKWKHSGDGDQAVYRLYMDRIAVLTAEMRKQKEAECAAKRLAEARASLVNTLASSDEWANQNSESLKNQNPYLYALAESGTADALYRLFADRPDLKSALAGGNPLEISSANMSESGKGAMRDLFKGLHRIDHQNGRNYKDFPEIPDSIGTGNDTITLRLNDNNLTLGLEYVAQISMESSSRSDFGLRFQLRDPKSPAARLEGQFIDEVWKGERTFDEINQEFPQKISEAGIPDWKAQRQVSEDPEAQHPDDPDLKLEKTDVIKPLKLYHIEDFAHATAEKFDLNVISDCFTGDFGGRTYGSAGQSGIAMSLNELLSCISECCNMNWWKRGKTIELRKRDWYTLRQLQIPDAWLKHWRHVFKDTGTLDIEDLSSIAQLSPEQYAKNVEPDEVLNSYKDAYSSDLFDCLRCSKGQLIFYSSLTSKEKQSIFSEKGLDLFNIRWDKRPALEKWLGLPTSLKSPLNPENGVTALRLYGTKNQDKKVFKYNLEVKADKGKGLQTWDRISFTTPTYVEPKKPVN